MPPVLRGFIAIVLFMLPVAARAEVLLEHPFEMRMPAEAVASIVAGCGQCDWASAGREAVVLKLTVDGVYSQHLLLTRGSAPSEYRVLLGPLPTGKHRLVVEREPALTAKQPGAVTFGAITIHTYAQDAPEHGWLSRAPILHARPESIERFTDVPLMMYAEAASGGYRYTVIFSHEDGGTPTDRLMATWGRSTDIEFVYGFTRTSGGKPKEEYQGRDHAIMPFAGPRAGDHPILWVSTDNNMFSDSGPPSSVRVAPAPHLVRLDEVSRETVMDANPWLYAVMAAELARESRIAADAKPGSGRIVDPRRFAFVEACGDLQDATLALDIGVEGPGGKTSWHSSDLELPRFRIARSGCFRAAAPLPEGIAPKQINGMRARAYTRPPREKEAPLPAGTGRVTLRRVNAILMLDDTYHPVPTGLAWVGSLELIGESAAAAIPVSRSLQIP